MNLAILSDLSEKKIGRLGSVRVDERVLAAVDELMAAHGIRNVAEYVRGLVYLDALVSGALPDDADVPHWVRRAHPQMFRRKAA